MQVHIQLKAPIGLYLRRKSHFVSYCGLSLENGKQETVKTRKTCVTARSCCESEARFDMPWFASQQLTYFFKIVSNTSMCVAAFNFLINTVRKLRHDWISAMVCKNGTWSSRVFLSDKCTFTDSANRKEISVRRNKVVSPTAELSFLVVCNTWSYNLLNQNI